VTTAAFSTTSLAVGSHTVTASYSGDDSFNSSSGTLSGGQLVIQASTTPTTTSVGSSVSASVFGQNVTFTATISASNTGTGTPSGTVQFQIDGNSAGVPLSVATSGGVTTASL